MNDKFFMLDEQYIQPAMDQMAQDLQDRLLYGNSYLAPPTVQLDENNLVVEEPNSYTLPASQSTSSITGTITLDGADLLQKTLQDFSDRLRDVASSTFKLKKHGVIRTDLA